MATTTTTKTTTTSITMSTNTKIPARTVRRTAKDEAADLRMFEENRLRAPYEEWPNEAGVSPPPLLHEILPRRRLTALV